MRLWGILLATAALCAACDGGGNDRPVGAPEPAMEYAEADAVSVTGSRVASEKMMAAPPTAASANGAGADEDADAAIPRQLAYEYDATLRLPAKAVSPVLSEHEARCHEAGPKVCQVISSNVTEANAENVYGSLEIRAAKAFMDEFRDGLAGDAEEADGQLVSMSSQVEDLTRQITDTTARLEAQKTLRDRLLRLLERETDDVGDLLQIERELARVQSEIESAESWLRTLRARVSMDRLTIQYQTIPKAVTPYTAQPLKNSLTSFLSNMAWSLAAVIDFIAALIPWMIVIVPGLWLLRALWRNWRKKK